MRAVSGVMQQRSSPGPGSQALRDLKYRPPEASGESPWHHFLYGHVPGHQLDFICAPAVSVGEMHAGHRNRMAEFIKFIDPSQGAPFGFLVGNLSLNDTRHMPGRGGLALMFAVRVRDARDHVGRKGSAFAHGIAAVNRRFEAAKITEAAAEMHRRISGDAVRCENAIEFYRQYSLAGEQEPARAVGLVEEYLGGFTRLPLLEQGEPTHYWKVREGVKRERVVVTYGEGDAAETILRSIARISAILYCSDVKWEAVAWSCSERFNDGLSVRIVAEGSAGPEGKPDIVAKLSELPAADAALAELLFGAVSMPYATLMPSSRRGRTTMAPGGPPRPTPAVVPAVLPRPTAPTTTPGALPGVRQREASIPPTPISTLAQALPSPSAPPPPSAPLPQQQPREPAAIPAVAPIPNVAAPDIDTEKTLSRPLELPPGEPPPSEVLPSEPPPREPPPSAAPHPSDAESSLDILISTFAAPDDTDHGEEEPAAISPAAAPPVSPPQPEPSRSEPTRLTPAPPASRSVNADGMVMSMPRAIAPLAAPPINDKPKSGSRPLISEATSAPTELMPQIVADKPRATPKPGSGPRALVVPAGEPTALMPQSAEADPPRRQPRDDDTRQTLLPEYSEPATPDDDIPESANLRSGARIPGWSVLVVALLVAGGGSYWFFGRRSSEPKAAPISEPIKPVQPASAPKLTAIDPPDDAGVRPPKPKKAVTPTRAPSVPRERSPAIARTPKAPAASGGVTATKPEDKQEMPLKSVPEAAAAGDANKAASPPGGRKLTTSELLDDEPAKPAPSPVPPPP